MYKKTDIRVHRARLYAADVPAVNVKVRKSLYPVVEAVMERWSVTKELAEKAVDLAFCTHQEQFWEYWGDESNINEYFPGNYAKVYSAGRSGGWLEVHNLKDLEYWDAIDVMRWYRFQRDVLLDVEYHTSKEVLLESIDSNDYYKPYSSQYNFVQRADGTSFCLADARQDVIEYSRKKYGMSVL